MATIIEPIKDLGHSVRRKFKKIIKQLPDDYIIRSPVYDDEPIADIVIEGPRRTWLMLGCHDAIPTTTEIQAYLSFCKTLKTLDNQAGENSIKYLAVTAQNNSLFDSPEQTPPDVEIIGQKAFFDDGAEIVRRHMTSINESAHCWLFKNIFPETHINAECTTRRTAQRRDTSAKLQDYFLDYDQEMATKLDMFDDSAGLDVSEQNTLSLRLINGVAGCGKTLILINRAILFCNKYPDKKVIFLIHNKPITRDIKYKFTAYLNGQPENLTILTFHQFALRQQGRVAGTTKPIFTPKELKPFREKVLPDLIISQSGLNLTIDQIWSEFEYINEFLITDEAAYLKYERQGRGFALQRTQRKIIWSLYKIAMSKLSSTTQGYLPSLYIRELCLADDDAINLRTYDHILLDEAQFFAPSWLHLVIKSLTKDGQLFMCADPNQGFLANRLSWKRLGLNVRGRTKKLHYSYRTTFEILTAANALLEHFDENPDDYIKPDLERMVHGGKPKVIYSDTRQDEFKRFLNELESIISTDALPLHHIMVLCNDQISPWSVKPLIERKLGRGTVINYNDHRDLELGTGTKIKLLSINSCTGMESGVVFVLGVGDLLNKTNNIDLNEEERELIHQEVIRKLYVAMTRAGQKLVLHSTVKLPKHIESLMKVA